MKRKSARRGMVIGQDHKKDWATTDWLLTHFWAKSRERVREMAVLPIRTGDHVLDVGCGPGIYAQYVADLVGPSGKVVGIDRLESSVSYANSLMSQRGCTHAISLVATLEEKMEEIADFDVVMFMNSLGYFEEPRKIVQLVGERLKRGGRIIVKDYDLESIFVWPVERDRLFELMESAWRGNAMDNPLAFNNFFGREVPFLSGAYLFAANETFPWAQVMTYPFSDAQKRYISENIVSLVDQARAHCNEGTLKYFERKFVEREGEFFNSPMAIFAEIEYVSVMTK